MNVEIGSEVTQFPEKEYINGIFLAVCQQDRNFKKSDNAPVIGPSFDKNFAEQS